jgi:hypothetical protein
VNISLSKRFSLYWFQIREVTEGGYQRANVKFQVGLHNMQGNVPVVKYVSLVEDGSDSPTPLGLVDALPLVEFLAPLETCKEQMAAAVDLLKPEGVPGGEASLDSEDPTPPHASRGLGGSLQVGNLDCRRV